MSNIKIFESPDFGQIRTAGTSDNPLFCLTDICKVLELRVLDVKKRLADPYVDSIVIGVQTGVKKDGSPAMQNKEMPFVSEPGLYKVIMRSDKPQAEAFQDWVCSEVLPSIRKSGGYIAADENESESDIMAKALLIAQETLKRREERIRSLREENEKQALKIKGDEPKVILAESITASDGCILISELAKILTQNGYKIGQRKLFEWLRNNGYLMKGGSSKNMPTQKYCEQGLFFVTERTIVRGDEPPFLTKTTKVTGKGQQYFINLFREKTA